jgi:hypothetical protein
VAVEVTEGQKERLAKNEAFFRTLNESIRGAIDRYGSDGHAYSFICECSDSTCVERVTLSTAEYERVRADGARFVLAPGHDAAPIETVVAEHADHVIVEKTGVAADVALALDPRAA